MITHWEYWWVIPTIVTLIGLFFVGPTMFKKTPPGRGNMLDGVARGVEAMFDLIEILFFAVIALVSWAAFAILFK